MSGILLCLRPGIILIKKTDESFEEFFVEDGTVEYFNNSLVILSSTAVQKKSLSKEFLEVLSKKINDELLKEDITDHDRYILNHKLDVVNQINI